MSIVQKRLNHKLKAIQISHQDSNVNNNNPVKEENLAYRGNFPSLQYVRQSEGVKWTVQDASKIWFIYLF